MLHSAFMPVRRARLSLLKGHPFLVPVVTIQGAPSILRSEALKASFPTATIKGIDQPLLLHSSINKSQFQGVFQEYISGSRRLSYRYIFLSTRGLLFVAVALGAAAMDSSNTYLPCVELLRIRGPLPQRESFCRKPLSPCSVFFLYVHAVIDIHRERERIPPHTRTLLLCSLDFWKQQGIRRHDQNNFNVDIR